jgi:hypothetical protein
MTQLSGLSGFIDLHPSRIQETDLVRFWVITSITLSIAGVTFVAMAAGYGTIVPQLFYFPILYTACFYPGRSMYVACSCAAIYLLIAASFPFRNPLFILGIVVQSLLFIGMAAGAGIVLRNRTDRPFAEPVDETGSIQAMIRTGECDHVEFKLRALWSVNLTKEEILASDSAEVRKYRSNASKLIVARSIAGFLNTEGGELLIGVREDRLTNTTEIVGIEQDYPLLQELDRNPDGYRRMIVDAVVRKYLPEIYASASRYIHITFPVIGDVKLCHLHITPAEKPVFVDTGGEEHFFIRIDASTRALTGKAMTRYILTRFSKT